MKILITGGLGYLGGMVSKHLLGEGHSIRIFDKRMPESEYKDYEIQTGSILEKQDLVKACKDIDCVIHLAALDQPSCKENPEKALEINGIGTRNVLEAAEHEGVRQVIYSSTFHIYGCDGKITEQTLPCPRSDYGISKLLGEYYCRQSGVNSVVLRFANVYGFSTSSLGWNLVVNDLCKQSFENQNIVLRSKGLQKRNFVSINEINQAISLILDSEYSRVSGEIFNVGSFNTLSISELARIVAQTYKKLYGQEVRVTIPQDAKDEPVKEFEYCFDKIKNIGYSPKAELKEEIIKIFKCLEDGTKK